MNPRSIIWCLAVILSVSFAACSSKSSNAHLEAKRMQKVLMDISLAEAYCTNCKDSLYRTGAKNYDSLSTFYRIIFEHHKITEDQFAQSLTWYKGHPDELDSIYSAMLPIVISMQGKK